MRFGSPDGERSPLPAALGFLVYFVSTVTACATGGEVDATGTGSGAAGTGGTGGSAGAETTGSSTSSSSTGGSTQSTTSSTLAFVASECPEGSYAVGLNFENALSCQPFLPAVREAINSTCSVYLGWRDACTECDLPPTKWGVAAAGSCTNGVGTDNTCTLPTLDALPVQLFGLNFDGDVNADDKIHIGFHCPAPSAETHVGPCELNEFATSIGEVTDCIHAASSTLEHVRTRCGLYFGWRDACDGCTSAPDRWGQVGPTGCTVGLGDTNTCSIAMLGDQNVQLFGLSTGGDVDGNDKLYTALHCNSPPAPVTTETKGSCPSGQLIKKLAADGTITCETPTLLVANYFDQQCTFYFGWSDGCDGCEDPPAKWGRMRNGFCTNDSGVDNTCTQTILGGKTLAMFGLSTDGDVDGNDKLYVGFRCQ
ncbi:MAG: hypothetical protein IPK82_15565 [Polyangiaceae bacterium]|nr:hypothetical protein [Polyangiaceae bacterium]